MELRSCEQPEPSHIHIPRPSRTAQRIPLSQWEIQWVTDATPNTPEASAREDEAAA
jgi:hypothetical protein